MQNRYQMYLRALEKPFKKISKIEFLNPDDSVAFSLDNNYKRGYSSKQDSRAFVQSGNLQVSLQNGSRRKATITLSNIDNAFDYSVNNLWFGKRVRLSMGLVLPDGTDFYLPQGVFYLENPNQNVTPNTNQIQYNLLDKWSYLDGKLFGFLPYSYKVERDSNIFQNIQKALSLSKYDLKFATNDPLAMVDSTTPIFTSYYNDLPDSTYAYETPSGESKTATVKATDTAFDSAIKMGGSIADLILALNNYLVGWVGYDPTGAFRLEASSEDIDDFEKAVLWRFSKNNSVLLSTSSAAKNTEVFNDIIVAGEGIGDTKEIYGRVTNYDPSSDTNVNLIGLKTQTISKPEYWKTDQCVAYASWILKRKTAVQKSVTIQSSQMFHLLENRLVEIQRTDKDGAPFEKHLIQSFSIPIGETGSMSITAVSVNDFSNLTTTVSDVVDPN